MNRVYVISQRPHFEYSKELGHRFFYNKNNPVTNLPTWYSPSLTEHFEEKPEDTINNYIKHDLNQDFYIQLIYEDSSD